MEFISGNIYIRKMGDAFKAGDSILGHTHNFDHTSIFFSGRWQVKRWKPAVDEKGVQLTLPDGKPAWVLLDNFEREGPFHLLIEAGCRHEFVFLGFIIPDWMQKYVSKMDAADAEKFKEEYSKSLGKAWCVYSHRTPQGDVSETATGWEVAYR